MNQVSDEEQQVTDHQIKIPPRDGASLPAAEELRIECERLSSKYIKTNKTNRKLMWAVIGGIILFTIIMASAIAIAGKSSAPREVLYEGGRRSTPEQVVNYIMDQNLGSSEFQLTNTGNIQHHAVKYLATEDSANLRVPSGDKTTHEGYRYVFRYIMALNFYSFHGREWKSRLGFLREGDVCDWHEIDETTGAVKGITCDAKGMPIALDLCKSTMLGRTYHRFCQICSLTSFS